MIVVLQVIIKEQKNLGFLVLEGTAAIREALKGGVCTWVCMICAWVYQ